MKNDEINIRDPFVVYEDGKYYMYGTRPKSWGTCTGGFDVYISTDLYEWSEPIQCFDSQKYGLNASSNWAPEVNEYKGKYYMFATFTGENGLRATYSLISDSLTGPFVPHSKGGLTPYGWECLDGTLYIDESGAPYLVFCHEHTQITDGTICYVRLNDTLDSSVGEAVTLFAASECEWVEPVIDGHFVTDGPFMYRSKTNELFLIWSSFIKEKYAVFAVKFKDGKLGIEFKHTPPLLTNDGGHGMVFSDGKRSYFAYHTPNENGAEHPAFSLFSDNGDSLAIKDSLP